MESKADVLWERLEQWSPGGFAIGGIGFLIALALLVVDTVATVTVPELALSVVVVPSVFILSLVGLPGFYPYVADESPRLALGGVVAATVAGASIALTTVGKIALDLLGVIGFTEEGPLLAGFFLWLIAFFLSMLFYGVASVRTGEPSRAVGLLLLVIVVEPAATLLNDLVGVDVGIGIAYATLGIAGAALLAIGYFLRIETVPSRRADPAPETVS